MSKYMVTHEPHTGGERMEDVEANNIKTIEAGDSHFLAFEWVAGNGTETRLVLPADTIRRIEQVG
jgi:hypothetical protein